MERTCMKFLKEWLTSSSRKPLVIRGARQVGKTWVVRHLAATEGMQLIEINLEKHPTLATLFESNEPATILRNLEQKLNVKINPSTTILFLDEIQERPENCFKLHNKEYNRPNPRRSWQGD